jgi:hypothetical protein
MPPFTGTATPRATVGIHLPAAAPRFVARIFGRHISLGDPGVADRNPAGPSPSLMRCATASTSADLVMSSRKTRHQIRVSPARSVHCRRGSAGDRPRQTLASAKVRHRPKTPPQPGLSVLILHRQGYALLSWPCAPLAAAYRRGDAGARARPRDRCRRTGGRWMD